MYWIDFTGPVTLRSDVARRTFKHESGYRTHSGLYFPTEGEDCIIDVTEATGGGLRWMSWYRIMCSWLPGRRGVLAQVRLLSYSSQ